MSSQIELIKILRDRTGAGLMDCKKALLENDSDIEKAIVWLREKGISKQEKKAGRTAAEGVAWVLTKGNKAAIIEINCETDFVANSDPFRDLVKAVNKAYEQYIQRSNASVPSGTYSPSEMIKPQADYIFIKTENRLVKVFFSEILYIKGYGDYIKIFLTKDRLILSLQSLNRIETLLPDTFIRVHRSFIISIDKISEIERRRIRIGNEMIPIGESYQERFFSMVQQ